MPLKHLLDFLREDSGINISKPCRALRQSLGKAFTIKTAKLILELRKDLDKEQKNDLLSFCDNTLEVCNKEFDAEDDTN